ncbi:MAG TPA: SdpI family protein, partial [Labilithrix sp.]|nr:SdpI family protein [Labilithrix sp.]
LYRAIVPGASIARVIWLLLGGFYVALGLVLPRIKRNALMGIRTPWTLTSDENWARTQRVGGYAMVGAGVVAALFGTLGGTTGGAVAIAALLVGTLVPAAYSLVLARRQDQGS